MKKIFVSICVLLIIHGCVSTSFRSDSQSQVAPESQGYLFKISKINYRSPVPLRAGVFEDVYSRQKIAEMAVQSYPSLFTNENSGIPLEVDVRIEMDGSLGVFVASLIVSMGVLPVVMQSSDKISLTLRVSEDKSKTELLKTVDYRQREMSWFSMLSPFGILPFPAMSDKRKTDWGLTATMSAPEFYGDPLVNAIAKGVLSLGKTNERKLKLAYSTRKEFDKRLKSNIAKLVGGGESSVVENNVSDQVRLLTDKLPGTKSPNGDAVAVVIGNRNYFNRNHDVPNVDFAHNDAEVVKSYLVKTLGFREGNIIFLKDATQADLIAVFGSPGNHKGKLYDWVRKGLSDVFVYYSGHGAPALTDGRGYLMPIDADPMKVELNGYSLDTMYRNLSKVSAKSLTILVDACFSGGSSKGSLVKNASSIALKRIEPQKKVDNACILTASAVSEVASWDEAKELGLFTRHFIEAVSGGADRRRYGNEDGKVTLAEIKSYLEDEVTYGARRFYGREQHPHVSGDMDRVFSSL